MQIENTELRGSCKCRAVSISPVDRPRPRLKGSLFQDATRHLSLEGRSSSRHSRGNVGKGTLTKVARLCHVMGSAFCRVVNTKFVAFDGMQCSYRLTRRIPTYGHRGVRIGDGITSKPFSRRCSAICISVQKRFPCRNCNVPSLQRLLPFVRATCADTTNCTWVDETGEVHHIVQAEGGEQVQLGNPRPGRGVERTEARGTPLRVFGRRVLLWGRSQQNPNSAGRDSIAQWQNLSLESSIRVP